MSVLAVAGLAARELARTRTTLALGAALALGLAALAWGTTGDGTGAGRVRAFLSVGSSWLAFVLVLAAVFVPTTFAAGLKDGRLVPLLATPLPREGLVLGWWLGQAGLLALLALLGHAALGGLAHALAAAAPPLERDAAAAVLAARGEARAAPLDAARVAAAVEARYRRAEDEGRLRELDPERREDVRQELEAQLRLAARTASAGRAVAFRVEAIRPAPGTRTVSIRFRYQARLADGSPVPEGLGPRGRLSIVPPGGAGAELEGTWAAGAVHELPAPLEVLEGRDAVEVRYELVDRRPLAVTFADDGPSVLYPAGGFWPNLLRAALVLAGRLAFLAALGVGLAALLEGRLAALAVLAAAAVGAGRSFLAEALAVYRAFGEWHGAVRAALEVLLALVPDLGRDDLGGLLAGGLEVPAAACALSLAVDALGRGGLLLGAGALLFARRELGAVR